MIHAVQLRTSIPPIQLEETLCSKIADAVLFPFRCLGEFFAFLIRPLVAFFLKVSVYHSMPLQQDGSVAQCFCGPLLRGVFNIWSWARGADMRMGEIDSERLSRSEAFVKQFAEFETLTTSDGHRIRFALYRPEKFNEWVDALGGYRVGDLIRPKTPADWDQLIELRKFNWFKEEGEAFRLPEANPALSDKCILRVQGFGRTIPMDKAFIGAHMALGIPYAVFDWRKDGLTSTGFFDDAETAYQALRAKGFASNQIVPMGSCRATFVIGKLKEDHHAEGLSAVMIQGPPSLEQMIQKQSCVASFLGQIALPAIETQKGDYDTIARMHRLQLNDQGKLCLILSENDQTIPDDTADQFLNLRACLVNVITQSVVGDHVDTHMHDPLRDPQVFHQYTQFLESAHISPFAHRDSALKKYWFEE